MFQYSASSNKFFFIWEMATLSEDLLSFLQKIKFVWPFVILEIVKFVVFG